MIKDPKRVKEHIIARGVARRSQRRDQNGPYHPDPEETAEILHRQRAEREAAVADIKAGGNWLKISKIVDDVANAKGVQFNSKKRNKIAMEVCQRIVLDSAAGRLGSEQFPP